jgi:prepilin-type N-terminal cleavage/methylation domain-containing protein
MGTRPAFTIIELLVVIAIIAILAALTTGAAMRFYSVQQQKNSEVTIIKLYEQLKNEWDTVVRQANTEPISPQAYALANYGSSGGSLTNVTPGVNEAQARVIHIKLRLKQEFPMDMTEILSPYPTDLPPLPTYKTAVAKMISAGFTPSNPPTPLENAICLYMALNRSRGGTPYNFDNLGSNALATDTSGTQRWIVDGWRTPIVFYRWPTQNFELDRLNPADAIIPHPTEYTFRDPEDSAGALFSRSGTTITDSSGNMVSNWWVQNHDWTAANRIWTPFEITLHSLVQIQATTPSNSTWPFVPPSGPAFPGNSGPIPNGVSPITSRPYYVWAYEYYMVPVIASAGPNKNFGLTPFPAGTANPMQAILATDTNNYGAPIGAFGDDSDNLYSYRLRLGAQGN